MLQKEIMDEILALLSQSQNSLTSLEPRFHQLPRNTLYQPYGGDLKLALEEIEISSSTNDLHGLSGGFFSGNINGNTKYKLPKRQIGI